MLTQHCLVERRCGRPAISWVTMSRRGYGNTQVDTTTPACRGHENHHMVTRVIGPVVVTQKEDA